MFRVYSKNGSITTLAASSDISCHEELIKEGWVHTATIAPDKWIEALMNGTPDNANDMMDELCLGPVANYPVYA